MMGEVSTGYVPPAQVRPQAPPAPPKPETAAPNTRPATLPSEPPPATIDRPEQKPRITPVVPDGEGTNGSQYVSQTTTQVTPEQIDLPTSADSALEESADNFLSQYGQYIRMKEIGPLGYLEAEFTDEFNHLPATEQKKILDAMTQAAVVPSTDEATDAAKAIETKNKSLAILTLYDVYYRSNNEGVTEDDPVVKMNAQLKEMIENDPEICTIKQAFDKISKGKVAWSQDQPRSVMSSKDSIEQWMFNYMVFSFDMQFSQDDYQFQPRQVVSDIFLNNTKHFPRQHILMDAGHLDTYSLSTDDMWLRCARRAIGKENNVYFNGITSASLKGSYDEAYSAIAQRYEISGRMIEQKRDEIIAAHKESGIEPDTELLTDNNLRIECAKDIMLNQVRQEKQETYREEAEKARNKTEKALIKENAKNGTNMTEQEVQATVQQSIDISVERMLLNETDRRFREEADRLMPEIVSSKSELEKEMWSLYNDEYDPNNEPFNLSRATIQQVTQEIMINTALIIISGGVGNLVRAGATAAAKRIGLSMAGRSLLTRAAGSFAGFALESWTFHTTMSALQAPFIGLDAAFDNYFEGGLATMATLGVLKGTGGIAKSFIDSGSPALKATGHVLKSLPFQAGELMALGMGEQYADTGEVSFDAQDIAGSYARSVLQLVALRAGNYAANQLITLFRSPASQTTELAVRTREDITKSFNERQTEHKSYINPKSPQRRSGIFEYSGNEEGIQCVFTRTFGDNFDFKTDGKKNIQVTHRDTGNKIWLVHSDNAADFYSNISTTPLGSASTAGSTGNAPTAPAKTAPVARPGTGSAQQTASASNISAFVPRPVPAKAAIVPESRISHLRPMLREGFGQIGDGIRVLTMSQADMNRQMNARGSDVINRGRDVIISKERYKTLPQEPVRAGSAGEIDPIANMLAHEAAAIYCREQGIPADIIPTLLEGINPSDKAGLAELNRRIEAHKGVIDDAAMGGPNPQPAPQNTGTSQKLNFGTLATSIRTNISSRQNRAWTPYKRNYVAEKLLETMLSSSDFAASAQNNSTILGQLNDINTNYGKLSNKYATNPQVDAEIALSVEIILDELGLSCPELTSPDAVTDGKYLGNKTKATNLANKSGSDLQTALNKLNPSTFTPVATLDPIILTTRTSTGNSFIDEYIAQIERKELWVSSASITSSNDSKTDASTRKKLAEERLKYLEEIRKTLASGSYDLPTIENMLNDNFLSFNVNTNNPEDFYKKMTTLLNRFDEYNNLHTLKQTFDFAGGLITTYETANTTNRFPPLKDLTDQIISVRDILLSNSYPAEVIDNFVLDSLTRLANSTTVSGEVHEVTKNNDLIPPALAANPPRDVFVKSGVISSISGWRREFDRVLGKTATSPVLIFEDKNAFADIKDAFLNQFLDCKGKDDCQSDAIFNPHNYIPEIQTDGVLAYLTRSVSTSGDAMFIYYVGNNGPYTGSGTISPAASYINGLAKKSTNAPWQENKRYEYVETTVADFIDRLLNHPSLAPNERQYLNSYKANPANKKVLDMTIAIAWNR